jgi:hypothetical protein
MQLINCVKVENYSKVETRKHTPAIEALAKLFDASAEAA